MNTTHTFFLIIKFSFKIAVYLNLKIYIIIWMTSVLCIVAGFKTWLLLEFFIQDCILFTCVSNL